MSILKSQTQKDLEDQTLIRVLMMKLLRMSCIKKHYSTTIIPNDLCFTTLDLKGLFSLD